MGFNSGFKGLNQSDFFFTNWWTIELGQPQPVPDVATITERVKINCVRSVTQRPSNDMCITEYCSTGVCVRTYQFLIKKGTWSPAARNIWKFSSIRVLFHQLMNDWIVWKTILKLTLKQLRHVSVQSHHHQGAYYSCLLKLQVLK